MTKLDPLAKEDAFYHMYLFSPGRNFAGGEFNNT